MKRAIGISLFVLLATFSGYSETANLGLKTVVIDAGHGGKDPGAVSADKITYEKSLTLDIAKKLAEKIRKAYPEVSVRMTRSDDSFVSLDSRAVKANDLDAQLFISIHINSCKSTSPNGYSIHVLGQSSHSKKDLFAYNMDVCKRENSVILLEDDYTTRYQGFNPADPESFIFMQLMQNAYLEQSLRFSQTVYDCLEGGPIKNGRGIWQNPFYVLWKTAMPAVLIELGFLSNPEDLAVLRSSEAREQLAGRVFSAFVQYKVVYDESVKIKPAKDTVAKEPVKKKEEVKKEEVKKEEVKKEEVRKDTARTVKVDTAAKALFPARQEKQPLVIKIKYGTQIFTLSRQLSENDPALLGYKPVKITFGNFTKYIIGVSEDLGEAEKYFAAIKEKYPDAYFVEIGIDGSVSRYSPTK